MLQFTRGGTTITLDPLMEPPRPPLNPRAYERTLVNRWAGLSTTSEGRNAGRPVTFASTNRSGFVTREQAEALIALYEQGGGLTITTDLLRPHGSTPQAYAAVFAPGNPPMFPPVTPDGTLYAFDMSFLIQGEL